MIQEAIYAIDRAAFNQGKNAKYNFSIDRGGKAQTIVAKGPGAVMVKISEVDTMEQYAVDFCRTADRIQMNPTQSTTLLGLGGGAGAKTGLYHLRKEGDNMEYIVRRLTPVECERLQGLPDEESFIFLDTLNKKVVFVRWLDLQKPPALYAEDKCHKRQRFVGIVEKGRLLENALFAEKNLQQKNQKNNKHVQVNALTNSEENNQEEHNLWERLKDVFSVEKSSQFHHQNQTINSAQLNVLMNTKKENAVHNGKEEQQNKEGATRKDACGIGVSNTFGNEIMQLAKGVEKHIQEMVENSQFTIYDLTEIAHKRGIISTILSYFVQNVTHMFTLKQGRIVAISLGVKGYTDVECNGKPASDSARYKAIGNGMAQPCADFVLGQVVKALTRKI